jgi:rSAM/selenodomain-associated transferase 2
MRLAVIIPTLNEADSIAATLGRLQALRDAGHEVIVVDGGSVDDTAGLAVPLADAVISSRAGRARQMNAGARAARGDLLWFVHADTRVQGDTHEVLLSALTVQPSRWGRFDVRLSGEARLLRLVEWLMNMRSRLTGIATGDQGIFVERETFERIGGFADIPLMEDIEISRRLKRAAGRPLCLRHRLITSSRRWETQGIPRTILLMWRLRLAYALGADPATLARHYR